MTAYVKKHDDYEKAVLALERAASCVETLERRIAERETRAKRALPRMDPTAREEAVERIEAEHDVQRFPVRAVCEIGTACRAILRILQREHAESLALEVANNESS